MARKTIKQLEMQNKDAMKFASFWERRGLDSEQKLDRLRTYLTNFKTDWAILWFLVGAWAASLIIFLVTKL